MIDDDTSIEGQQEEPSEPTSPDPMAQADPQQLDIPDDAVNLVPILRAAGEKDEKVKKWLETEMPEQVIDHFNEDWEGREEWIERKKELVKLWLGALEEKDFPFKNCANMHVPILLKSTLRLACRTWGEIFKQGQPIFSAVPSSALNSDRADIITKHENWQFTKEMPDFPKQVFRALIEFFRDGDCVFDSYHDLESGTNRHEYLSTDEFVYPYVRKTLAPDMSDVPRKTKILYPYKRDIMARAKSGVYDSEAVEDVIAHDGAHDNDVSQVVKDAVDAFEGHDRTEAKSDAPYTLLEYHGWAQLPYQEEEMPIRAVVDVKSRVLLGLYSRYYDDPDDRVRFDRETQEYEGYVQSLTQHMQAMKLERDAFEAIQQPHVPPDEAMAIAQQIQAERPQPPIKPQWMKFDQASGMPQPPAPVKRKIYERFSHATCIENPDGSHGLGIGLLVMPHQMAANIMLNQYIDQGTLANTTTGFMHENFKIDPGVKTLNPGEIIRVAGVPPSDLKNAFFQLTHNPGNGQLLQGVQMQQAEADGISSAPDVLSGVKEGTETFRGQATRVEQAVQQLSVFGANFLIALTQIEKNNALLNSQFLPDSKMMDVLDPTTRRTVQIKVGRELYKDTYDIQFSADLSFTSRAAKVAESDDAMGLLMKGVPPQLASLIFKPGIFSLAVRKCLEARGLHDMAAFVKSPEEVEAAVQQQMMQPPPGAGPGGPMPNPSIPTGQKAATPGTVPSQSEVPTGVPLQAAPNAR